MISLLELTRDSSGVPEFIKYVEQDPKALEYLGFSSIKSLIDYIRDDDGKEFDNLRKELEQYKEKNGLGEMHTMADDGADEFHQVRADAIEEKSKGLWPNIHAKHERGEKPARKGSEAYKKAKQSADRINAMDETDSFCEACLKEYLLEYADKIEEAEYRGRKVSLGKPFLTPGGPKKRSVYVKNQKGNVVKVNFGDPNMRIKKSIPARRKSYRARHHCDNPGPRWKANYWSCKAW